MAKKRVNSENNEKKKRSESQKSDVPVSKKKKLIPEEDAQDAPETESLTPEEERILERKLKKERKKEEKRLKREGIPEEKKEDPAKPSACELALQYLKSWSKKQSEWRFQKTRQTWLLMNMYDQAKVPDKYFKILLDYLGGLKGNARETTVQKAEAFMKEYDKSEPQEESDLQRITRIREVLQLLS
ncbi:protein cholesin isoform X2 [Mixophyes fleayi]|uniref:protein cholesin isoform X2 n=1 Tax=Mixophyes fleayi TaxID=3061075 RepID=UPI003F4D7D95